MNARTALVLAALPFLAVACRDDADSSGRYAGTVEFADVEVGSLVGGRVVEVLKNEGDDAAAGDTLVALDPQEWKSALDEATALADVARRELDLMQAGPRAEEIAEAEAQARRLELLWKVTAQGSRPEEVEAARENARAADARRVEAEQEADRIRTLVRQKVETADKLERAVAALDVATADAAAAAQRVALLERGLRPDEIEAARQAWVAQTERVKALRAGARPEEIAAKRAALDATEARIRLAKSKLDELRIVAPVDCVVQTLDLRPGDMVAAGRPVAVLLLRERPTITIYVPEAELARVTLGQTAQVTPDGHEALAGTVTWISRRAEYTPRNVQTKAERVTQVFAVKVTLAGDAASLKDGMWADVALR